MCIFVLCSVSLSWTGALAAASLIMIWPYFYLQHHDLTVFIPPIHSQQINTAHVGPLKKESFPAEKVQRFCWFPATMWDAARGSRIRTLIRKWGTWPRLSWMLFRASFYFWSVNHAQSSTCYLQMMDAFFVLPFLGVFPKRILMGFQTFALCIHYHRKYC